MSIRQNLDGNDKLFWELFGAGPIKVRWGPWITDTHMLQHAGWTFAAEEHFDSYLNLHCIRLIAKCPQSHVVMSGEIFLRREQMCLGSAVHANYLDSLRNQYEYDWGHRPIEMRQFTSRDVFRELSAPELRSWEEACAIDIYTKTHVNQRQVGMRNFKFFKQLQGYEEPKQELYIPPESVDDLFNKILAIQYPHQQEIKKKLIHPETKTVVQAKIYSLVA